MKIMKEIEFSEMVEVNITADDIIEILSEMNTDDNDHYLKNTLNTCLLLIAKFPDEMIEKLGDAVRGNVVRHLESQILRYKEKQ